MVERGLDTAEKIDRFFKPEYERDLYDPFLLKDMRLACERIHKAVLGQEKIIIYSDYDVDGVSAATVLSEYFRGINYPFEIYLPDRQKEGHGVNQNTLEQLIAAGANLIVTLDCGTTNSKEVQWAKDRGVDMIVVDHHKVIVGRPAAAAFINPHQIGDNYPFKDLCGTGLAFKLYQGLKKGSEKKGEEKWLLDLVALATVADMVPMLDENRVFVKYGLFVLAKTKRVGLQMLMESSGIKARHNLETLSTNLDAMTLGFSLGPRLNAASRMAHANLAYELLNSPDESKIQELVTTLNQNNRERQRITEKILKELDVAILKRSQIPMFIMEGSPAWPLTLVGLAAAKASEKYYRPALIFEKRDDGLCRGSLRSINGFNLIDAFKCVSEYLIKYGGHPSAAGCTFKAEEEETIREKLNEYAQKILTPELLRKKLNINAEVSFDEVNWDLMGLLEKFEPFGMANPKPRFLTKNVGVKKLVLLGQNGAHLKIFARDTKTGREFPILFFRHNGLAEDFKIGDTLDVVYELDENEWDDSKEIQLKLIDYAKK